MRICWHSILMVVWFNTVLASPLANHNPIQVQVPIGKERSVHFPHRITVTNTDNQLTTKHVRLMNNNGTLYILAHEAFGPSRLQVALDKGPVLFVDIQSVKHAPTTPVIISLPHFPTAYWQQQLSALRIAIAIQQGQAVSVPHWMQSLNLIALPQPGLDKQYQAIAQHRWQLPTGYLSVIRIINKQPQPVRFNPQTLKQVIAFSVYPRQQLGPSTSHTNYTDWFVLSRNPRFLDAS